MRSRNQVFADQVWRSIPYTAGQPEAKKYGGMAQQLPGLIRTAGLAQALAFAESKNQQKMNKPYPPAREMLDHLARIVLSDPNATILLFSEQVRAPSTDLAAYMRLTRRSLEVCLWFKRFAESKLDVKPGDEVNDEDTESGS